MAKPSTTRKRPQATNPEGSGAGLPVVGAASAAETVGAASAAETLGAASAAETLGAASIPGGNPAQEEYPLAPFEMMDAPALDVRLTGARIETQSLIFDPHWYLWRYTDIEAAGVDPVQHYFANGAREGRDPNRYFSTNWYAQTYPDVVASGSNPFLHYVLYGAREGRKPRP